MTDLHPNGVWPRITRLWDEREPDPLVTIRCGVPGCGTLLGAVHDTPVGPMLHARAWLGRGARLVSDPLAVDAIEVKVQNPEEIPGMLTELDAERWHPIDVHCPRHLDPVVPDRSRILDAVGRARRISRAVKVSTSTV